MSRERGRRGIAASACALLLLAGAGGCAMPPPDVAARPPDDGFLAALLAVPLGEALAPPDRRLAVEAIQRALASGEYSTWENPDTGHSGSVTPFVAYENLDGRSCRQFHQAVEVDDERAIGFGRACQRPDGSWEIAG